MGGARNTRSEERAREPESDDAYVLLVEAHREIRLLLAEMMEFLARPDAHYALFPILKAALLVVMNAEENTVYRDLARDPSFAETIRQEAVEQSQIHQALAALDQGEDLVSANEPSSWRKQYVTLNSNLERWLAHADEVLPVLATAWTDADRHRLGRAFKEALARGPRHPRSA